MQSPLAGVAGTNCYSLIWPDTLHQGDKGDVEYMLDLLPKYADEDTIRAIDQRLMAIPPFPGLPMPSQGTSTQKMYASQQAALSKCLPVVLLRLPGNLDEEIMAAMRTVILGEFLS